MLDLTVLLSLALALPPEDEQELARAIRKGDRSAFRRFFERYHEPLLRYLIHRRVDPDTAEDLVQNAFVHVWERRKDIREDGSLRGLLFRIGYTRALNHFRDTARFSDVTPEEAEDHGHATEDPASAREVRERVANAVAALPERRRAVFELCALQGLSYREASEALDISLKTVENHMGLALKSVRKTLEILR